jgi:hypothetical protein
MLRGAFAANAGVMAEGFYGGLKTTDCDQPFWRFDFSHHIMGSLCLDAEPFASTGLAG